MIFELLLFSLAVEPLIGPTKKSRRNSVKIQMVLGQEFIYVELCRKGRV